MRGTVLTQKNDHAPLCPSRYADELQLITPQRSVAVMSSQRRRGGHVGGDKPSTSLFFDKSQTFSSLGLDRRLFKAIARHRLVYPSLVQSKSIPLLMTGTDALIHATTGSGKTLAYMIPLIQALLTHKTTNAASDVGTATTTRAIILAPTKELCAQIAAVCEWLCFFCQDIITVALVTSDQPAQIQVAQLSVRPVIVIGTPQRVVSHITSGAIALTDCIQLIVDEADLICNYGYDSELRALANIIPRQCQTVLLSATLSANMKTLTSFILHSPTLITLRLPLSSTQLQQRYVQTSDANKFLLTYTLIQLGQITGKTLFFTETVENAYRLKLFLEQFSLNVAVMNGELPFNSRLSILRQFNRGMFNYLIATDAATEQPEKDNDEDADEDEDEDKSKIEDQQDVTPLSSNDAMTKEEDTNSEATVAPPELGAHIIIEKRDDSVKNENAESAEDAIPSEDNDVDEANGEEAIVDDSRTVVVKPKKSDGRKRRRTSASSSYGVSRGIDFEDVSTVVNFDFPRSVKSYIHRTGRTARAGRAGNAISFVCATTDQEPFISVVQHQINTSDTHPPAPQLTELAYPHEAAANFQYRASDCLRAVTRLAVKEARMKEFKYELINSEKLKAHFEDHPRDLQLLKHDLVLRPHRIQKHLAHIPDYLRPKEGTLIGRSGSGSGVASRKRKKKRARSNRADMDSSHRAKQTILNDPLRSFKRTTTAQSSQSNSANTTTVEMATKRVKPAINF